MPRALHVVFSSREFWTLYAKEGSVIQVDPIPLRAERKIAPLHVA